MRVSKDQIDSYFKNLSLINESMPVGIKLITAQKLMVELTNELLRRDDNSSQQAFTITCQLNKLCKSYKKNSHEFYKRYSKELEEYRQNQSEYLQKN